VAREEFSRKTKLEAFTRCGGRCEGCGARLRPGHFDYDHDKPSAFGGDASIANCRVLCSGCHGTKTFTQDIPRIAKSNRIRKREAGIKKRSTFSCSKQSKWKKKVTGEVVLRRT
jgi:5-methylcytosine-specific restriction protein A